MTDGIEAATRLVVRGSARARAARTGILATLFCALAMMGTCAWASAASISLANSDDPLANQAVTVTVSGTADSPSFVYAALHSGGTPCAANPGTESPESGTGNRLLWDGPTVTGSFSRTASWTPTANGAYTLCAYLQPSSNNYFAVPYATGTTALSVRRPVAGLTFTLGANLSPSDPLAVGVSGQAEGSRYLFVAAVLGTGPCGATAQMIAPDGHSAGRILWPDYGDASGIVGPGPFTRALAWTPPAARALTICGLVSDAPYDSVPYGSTSASLISCCAPPVPVATHTGAVPFGRPIKLAWSKGYATAHRITVYRADPAKSPQAAVLERIDGDDDQKATDDQIAAEHGQRNDVEIPGPPLRPGTYWWTVTRSAGDWPSTTSKPERFTVVPAPLSTFKVSAIVSGELKVTTAISVQATPYSAVALTATRNGKTVVSRRYTQLPRSAQGTLPSIGRFSVKTSCSRPGLYRYRVTAHDAHGHTRAQAGTWRVYSCAQLAAWARDAARAVADEERQEQIFADQCHNRGGFVRDGRCLGVAVIIVFPLDD